MNDERDHGDGSDTRPRGRRTSGSLTETRVCDWQYWRERFDGSADQNTNPCSLDGTDQRARTVLAACVEPDGPVDADGEQALVIDDARHPAFLSGGEAARPWEAATGAPVRRPRLRRCSWPRLVAPRSHDLDVAWRVNGLAAQSGIEPSGPREATGAPPGVPGSVFETYVNASKSDQLSRKGSMCVSRSAVWKESARWGRRPPWRSR